MILFLALLSALAVIWSMFKYQTTYVALIESLPPQFQDGLSSKFAFPEYVLNPSTPLALQADYVKSQIGFCFATIGIALLCFFSEKIVAGMFFIFTALTGKSWKIYTGNRNRRLTVDDQKEN
jgi:hypothetical protein